jgi:2-polyprenyl-3-methyl-5-hydroxy-6-metoxy-1,4-benzoquinol methylase
LDSSIVLEDFMPTVEQNLKTWDIEYKWPEEGEEWSVAWGGSEAQWFGAIFPRIHAFLPTGTILEIAPGLGRWTNYLKNYCNHLVIVDLGQHCIDACQQRFASDRNITYHINDGQSLAMIEDNSIDFVFSFDSLVHAEADIIQAYMNQLAKKLRPNGVGFIHHSNIGRYQRIVSASQRLPGRLRQFLTRIGVIDPYHWRAFTMTAEVFEKHCNQAGLQCISQELVNWGTKGLTDCFSLFTPKTSSWSRSTEILENPNFMKEANSIKYLSHLYSSMYLRSNGKNTSNPKRN